jgi:hypothetical protein
MAALCSRSDYCVRHISVAIDGDPIWLARPLRVTTKLVLSAALLDGPLLQIAQVRRRRMRCFISRLSRLPAGYRMTGLSVIGHRLVETGKSLFDP